MFISGSCVILPTAWRLHLGLAISGMTRKYDPSKYRFTFSEETRIQQGMNMYKPILTWFYQFVFWFVRRFYQFVVQLHYLSFRTTFIYFLCGRKPTWNETWTRHANSNCQPYLHQSICCHLFFPNAIPWIKIMKKPCLHVAINYIYCTVREGFFLKCSLALVGIFLFFPEKGGERGGKHSKFLGLCSQFLPGLVS